MALFDPQDAQHQRCRGVLQGIREPLFTTVPVLIEGFRLLSPGGYGLDRLRDFIMQGGVSVWFMDRVSLERAFALMEQYADHLVDLADASLIVAAETLNTRRAFTITRRDFGTYRIRRVHKPYTLEIVA